VRSKISEALSGTLLCDIICAEALLQPIAEQPTKVRVIQTNSILRCLVLRSVHPNCYPRKLNYVSFLFKDAEIAE
jgi:hypothetical protein